MVVFEDCFNFHILIHTAVRFFIIFLFAGALSPLHTRRGPLNDLVTPTPDFAEFDYLHECPKLLAVTSDEDCQNVAVTFSDLVFS